MRYPNRTWWFSALLLLAVLFLRPSSARFDVTVEEDPLGVKRGERVKMTVRADVDLEDCRYERFSFKGRRICSTFLHLHELSESEVFLELI